MAHVDLSKTRTPDGSGGSRRGAAMVFGGVFGIAIGGVATAVTGSFLMLLLFAALGLLLGYAVFAPLIVRMSH